jgi:hypothetical protein
MTEAAAAFDSESARMLQVGSQTSGGELKYKHEPLTDFAEAV